MAAAEDSEHVFHRVSVVDLAQPEASLGSESSTAPDIRPGAPDSGAKRPAVDRQESSHEYTASGLDNSPRTATRNRHIKAPSKQKNAFNPGAVDETTSPTSAEVVRSGSTIDPAIGGPDGDGPEYAMVGHEEAPETGDPHPVTNADEPKVPKGHVRTYAEVATIEDPGSSVEIIDHTSGAALVDDIAGKPADIPDLAKEAPATENSNSPGAIMPTTVNHNGLGMGRNGENPDNAVTNEQNGSDSYGARKRSSGDGEEMPQEPLVSNERDSRNGGDSFGAAERNGNPPLRDTKGDAHDGRDQDEDSAYRAGGMRFAPWNVPLQRRLQTLAVLFHSVTIGCCLGIFWFLCAIPLMWPVLLWYLVHLVFSNDGFDGSLHRRRKWLRSLRLWRWFADYFPAMLHKTADLPPTRKYIFGYHPHGIISHGAWVAFGTEALGFSELFPGITNSLCTLDSNFRTPLYKDYVLAMGLQSVSKESITNILSKGGRNGEGMGRAVTIVVGGARESLAAQPGTMRLILKGRKGFVKLALRSGADLVPVIAFGETDLYNQLTAESHPKLHKIQMWILKVAKFTLPFLHGRGIFNYDVGLLPYRRPLNIVVGAPIRVVQSQSEDVPPEDVDRVHAEYMEALQELWNAHKDRFAKDRTEEMQFLA